MKKLTVLVVEYVTGGGFASFDLPGHLANEGLLMLHALLKSLAGIEHIEYAVMLDARLIGRLETIHVPCRLIGAEQSFHPVFEALIKGFDAVWPIAPESEGILQSLCSAVERANKILLTSPASAVAIAGNKWLTYQCLRHYAIPVVETSLLADFTYFPGKWMVKPVDGVGCEASFRTQNVPDFNSITAGLDKDNYIIQPHLDGDKISLSCLFKQGRGWLICANRQHFAFSDNRYRLTGLTVNLDKDLALYRALVQDIAGAMPDLWGYAGIDLIESNGQFWVLEINPRLTTSFAGIDKACGLQCARSVLQLLDGEPDFQPDNGAPIYIDLET